MCEETKLLFVDSPSSLFHRLSLLFLIAFPAQIYIFHILTVIFLPEFVNNYGPMVTRQQLCLALPSVVVVVVVDSLKELKPDWQNQNFHFLDSNDCMYELKPKKA